MNKHILSLLTALGIAGGMFFPSQALTVEPEFTLSMTTAYMERNPLVQEGFLAWARDIEARSNGRVVINYFGPNTIAHEGEIFEAVKIGQVDIGAHMVSRNTGRLPVSMVSAQPSVTSTPMAAAAAFWRLYEQCPALQKEYEGMKLISLYTTASANLTTIKEPVLTQADLQRRKILTGGSEGARTIRILGGNPVTMPFGDFYLSLQRNMAEGGLAGLLAIHSTKLHEVTNYTTLLHFLDGGIWIGMNQTTWDSLPPDLQQVFEETGGEVLSQRMARITYENELLNIQLLEEQGHEISTLEEAERLRWIEQVRPAMREEWGKMLKARKISNIDEIYELYMRLCEEAEAEYRQS